ncbi:MAG: 3-carboxy-cis,cis-muconate cycloisomerase [Acidimicrobiia bacterium]|nr:3-carboxy-cis,cis-muconate cycloisomerase [Acidimicrobiia bacterium]
MTAPFSLLNDLYADEEMITLFSETSTIGGWLRTEAALARAQAVAGVISTEAADAIEIACDLDSIDTARLWDEARNVGYPILPLVRMVAATLPPVAGGKLHLGATTQDIMDTGLALQLTGAIARVENLVTEVGDLLAGWVDEHRNTLMAGRTHGQQAVPTTLGAKLAVYLAQFDRHRTRLEEIRPRVGVVSLHGAGGTSAAYGPTASQVRDRVAEYLDLETTAVPWHSARDGVAEFGFVCAAIAATCVRLAREVIDLARTEIGEIRESSEVHHGASSTMPQKANPIWSEAVVGFGATAATAVSALLRAMEAGHERAAGEWHIEWDSLPRVAVACASALRLTAKVLATMSVDQEAMVRNLDADGGLIMAEALMMRLAPALGREEAHDIVYEAARRLRDREEGVSTLAAEVKDLAPPDASDLIEETIPPGVYLGEVAAICTAANESWARNVHPPKLSGDGPR